MGTYRVTYRAPIIYRVFQEMGPKIVKQQKMQSKKKIKKKMQSSQS